jgi:hypothetical protein
MSLWNKTFTPAPCPVPEVTQAINDQLGAKYLGIPVLVVQTLVTNEVAAACALADHNNLVDVRQYLGGQNDDGSIFIGDWPYWLAGYQSGNPVFTLATEPQPKNAWVLDLTGPSAGVMRGAVPVCSKPDVPAPAPTPIVPAGTSTLFGGTSSPSFNSDMLTAISGKLDRILKQFQTP